MYNYDYENLINSTMNSEVLKGLALGIFVISTILEIIMLISFWKVFKKAGKPGWAILIPIYNIIVLIQVAGLSLIYLLLLFIPVVNIYAYFKVMISIAKRFDKSTGFGLGLAFLPIIFFPMLAFSDAEVNNMDSSNSEENNDNNKEFNAMNVINENVNSNVEAMDSAPVAPNLNVETTNINEPNESINVVNTDIATDNNELESTDVENINEPVDSINTESEINNVDATLNQVSNEVNVSDNIVEPINETNSENTIIDEVNNVTPIDDNIVNEPNVFNPVNDETVSEENIPSENMNNNTDLNNSVNNLEPSIDTEVIDNVETNEVNAFNSKPIDNTIEKVAKVCKNCGEQMPDIVSICPKCGTENE